MQDDKLRISVEQMATRTVKEAILGRDENSLEK